jgi:hypothetical protein
MSNPLMELCCACAGQSVPAKLRIIAINLSMTFSYLGERRYNENSFCIEVQFDVYLSFLSIIVRGKLS